jgi:hypothetical protein
MAVGTGVRPRGSTILSPPKAGGQTNACQCVSLPALLETIDRNCEVWNREGVLVGLWNNLCIASEGTMSPSLCEAKQGSESCNLTRS